MGTNYIGLLEGLCTDSDIGGQAFSYGGTSSEYTTSKSVAPRLEQEYWKEGTPPPSVAPQLSVHRPQYPAQGLVLLSKPSVNICCVEEPLK